MKTILFVLLALAQLGAALAQTFPSRPLRIIVPFPPGGLNDVVARAVSDRLSERLGQPVLVENRAGANTVIGTEMVAKSPPDGHTILLSSVAHSINPSLLKNLPYDPARAFSHITILCSSPFILVVRPNLPAQNVQEFIALARAQAGKITYGSTGNGGSSHLMGEMLKSMAGIDILHVPYKGMSPVVADLLGGQIDATFVSYSTIGGSIRAGKVRALAASSMRRLSIMPELPTIHESGYPGYDANPWWGLAVPAGTPEAIVARLNAEASRIVRMPEVVSMLRERGVDVIGGTPAEALEFFTRDSARWAKIVRESGARVD